MSGGLWAFISDPANQATLAWLGGGLVTAVGAFWTAFVYLRAKPKGEGPSAAGTNVRAERGGLAAGRDVHVGGDLTVADRRWSPAALAVLALGAALLVALWQGEGCVVGVGLCNTGSIEDSTITIQGGAPTD
jgi:hypothetical protein